MKIAGQNIPRGSRQNLHLKIGKIYDSTDLGMPIHVIRGEDSGPNVFLSAAIHGDEINGTEILREVLKFIEPRNVNGTIMLVPIVNVFGFNYGSRFLPDRKDLNRSFPGNPKGSLASRIAHLFMKEIVIKCSHGIDFHTGSIHRSNYPQIRADLDDQKTLEFAQAFCAPVTVNAKLRDGSLREAARKRGVRTLLFEGGQALRFEDHVVKVGVKGCLRALEHIGSLKKVKIKPNKVNTILAQGSYWVRSPMGGTMRLRVKEGQYLIKGERIGEVISPLEEKKAEILCDLSGYVIGINQLPLVTLGDAVVHLATSEPLRNSQFDLMDERDEYRF